MVVDAAARLSYWDTDKLDNWSNWAAGGAGMLMDGITELSLWLVRKLNN